MKKNLHLKQAPLSSTQTIEEIIDGEKSGRYQLSTALTGLMALAGIKKKVELDSRKISISDYLMTEPMSDLNAHDKSGLKPISWERFIPFLDFLVVRPQLGKEYLKYELYRHRTYCVHLECGNHGIHTVCIQVKHGVFYCTAPKFNRSNTYHAEGTRLLSLNFATQVVPSEPVAA